VNSKTKDQKQEDLFLFLHFEVFLIHLFTCAYIVWAISPPSPYPPHFQIEPVLPLSLILLKRRHRHNPKHKALLLVEIRVATQRVS
jgi:hypothetical protein